MKKILFLVNHDITIYNYRLELVEELVRNGNEVHISSPYGEKIDELIDIGCKYHYIKIARHGTNPLRELKLIKKYKDLIYKIKPDIVFSYTIKPNIYGGIACRILGTPYVVNITGLGTAIEKSGLIQKTIILLYKFAFKNVQKVFFQNTENMRYFKKCNIAISKHSLLPGSGVNLERNNLEPYPEREKPISFLFVGRLMKDKGYTEYVKAAQIIKDRYANVEFHSIGFCEREYETELMHLNAEKYVTAHGHASNVHDFIKLSHTVVLPSYHEGMANVLLEASACGRPVIASNIAGCRETFDESISGISCVAKSVSSLVDAIEMFIRMPYEEKREMGLAARRKVEKEFDRKIVVDAYMNEVRGLDCE